MLVLVLGVVVGVGVGVVALLYACCSTKKQ